MKNLVYSLVKMKSDSNMLSQQMKLQIQILVSRELQKRTCQGKNRQIRLTKQHVTRPFANRLESKEGRVEVFLFL